MAHLVLSGALAKLETVRVDSCQIRDLGMKALFNAINAQSIKYLMPHLKLFSMKNNHPTPELMRKCGIIPPHIMI